jgi:hypothetical protein
MSDNPIGEIVEAGTTAFIAQCLEVPREIVPKLYDPPPFGSFVKVLSPAAVRTASAPSPLRLVMEDMAETEEQDPFAEDYVPRRTSVPQETPLPAATFALVYGANTASLDAGRRPSALGFADEDELRSQQPQIFELLRTEFSGLLIAYSDGDDKGLRRHLPPKPPRIHSRVYPCDAVEMRRLTEDLSFLRGLLLPSGGALSGVPSDELVAACLRGARDAQTDDHGFLLRAGKTLAMLLADDYDRLQSILRNVL